MGLISVRRAHVLGRRERRSRQTIIISSSSRGKSETHHHTLNLLEHRPCSDADGCMDRPCSACQCHRALALALARLAIPVALCSRASACSARAMSLSSIGAALEFDTGYWLYWVGEATLVPGGRITSHRSKNAQTKKKLPPCSTAARRRTAQETRGDLEDDPESRGTRKENGSERVQIVACWSPRSAAAGDRVGAHCALQ